MPMNITFELSDKDLRYFKRIIREVRARSTGIEESKLIAAVRQMIAEVGASNPAEFISQRLAKLERMVTMLEDEEWDMEGKDRSRVADGLIYFAEGEDMIPDRVPGLGYLDDAIMIELVTRELAHEIQAYRDFCDFRKRQPKQDATRLESRRENLQSRMRRRRRQERSTHRSGPRPSRSPLRLW